MTSASTWRARSRSSSRLRVPPPAAIQQRGRSGAKSRARATAGPERGSGSRPRPRPCGGRRSGARTSCGRGISAAACGRTDAAGARREAPRPACRARRGVRPRRRLARSARAIQSSIRALPGPASKATSRSSGPTKVTLATPPRLRTATRPFEPAHLGEGAVEDGHQRSPLPSPLHVGGTKIVDHGCRGAGRARHRRRAAPSGAILDGAAPFGRGSRSRRSRPASCRNRREGLDGFGVQARHHLFGGA